MKVLQANSIILSKGPFIKDVSSNFSFLTIVQPTWTVKALSEALPNLTYVIEHFGLSKKAAVISNFCLIGKIHHTSNDLIGLQDFHAYSDLRSTQRVR
jgi:hypothetical protein